MILYTEKMAAKSSNLKEKTKMENLCKECGKAFASKSSLSDHERRHSGMAPYKCCGKSYFSKANLTRHRCSVHGAEKSFKCDKCSRSFALRGDMLRHERQETCGPRLKCDTCGASFHNKGDLADHMDIHSGEKRFTCKCGKAYRYHQGLSRHRKTCQS